MKTKLSMFGMAMMVWALVAGVDPVWATQVTLNFTSLFGGASAGDQGASLNFDGLTITAKTNVGTASGPDPFSSSPPARNGVAADIFWGNLGDLNVTGANYFGLGVLGTSSDPNPPINKTEALLFSFDRPQNSWTDLTIGVLGLNATASGNAAFPADNMRVYYKVVSGEVGFVDINAGAIPLFGPNYVSAINYGLQYVTYADERVTDFAVEQLYGSATGSATNVRNFGIGTLTYEAPAPVPEPGTTLLLGLGLMGLAGVRRSLKSSEI